MKDLEESKARLKAARDGFWVSLGGYALLTHRPAMTLLHEHRIEIRNTDLLVIPKAEPKPHRRGTSYEISFNNAVDVPSARNAVDRSLRFMIVDTFETVSGFAKANNANHYLRQEDWYWLAFHLRNAFAHGGIWQFRSTKHLPAKWRNLEVDDSLEGNSVRGFIGWFDGLQLGAVMNVFADQLNSRCKQA